MNPLQLQTIELKAFVPAQDFERAMAFYQALGFTCASVYDGIAYLHFGNTSFLLQDFYVPEHAANTQMHLLVANVNDWYQQAAPVAARFGVQIGQLEDQPWGMRDFTLLDPSGVVWRVAQNMPRPGQLAAS